MVASLGAQKALPAAMQLYLVAASRANVWGHAPFENWADLKRSTDRSRSTLESAIETLKCGQVISPASTHLCIVLSAEIYRRSDKAFHPCHEASHRGKEHKVWAHGIGWSETDDWNRLVQQDNAMAAIEAQRVRTVTTTETVTETVRVVGPADELMGLIANAPDARALDALLRYRSGEYTDAHRQADTQRRAAFG